MPKIGPVSSNYTTEFLDNMGREYSDYHIIDPTRIRSLEGVPDDNQMSLVVVDPTGILFEGGDSHFTVVQQDESKCPVFMLPTVSWKTLSMDDNQRAAHMKKIFDACYDSYASACRSQGKKAVPKSECAATNVAGTRTVFGHIQGFVTDNRNAGAHFTALIKPPGTERWSHVDPTSFLGPQRFNRKQCGGYSTMIEAQAVAKYSSYPRSTAQQAPSMVKQVINEIIFKISTWFAGMRNKVTTNPKGEKVEKALLETSYGEMADFNAQELAKQFDNAAFFKQRQKPPVATEEAPLINKETAKQEEDDFDMTSSSSFKM